MAASDHMCVICNCQSFSKALGINFLAALQCLCGPHNGNPLPPRFSQNRRMDRNMPFENEKMVNFILGVQMG